MNVLQWRPEPGTSCFWVDHSILKQCCLPKTSRHYLNISLALIMSTPRWFNSYTVQNYWFNLRSFCSELRGSSLNNFAYANGTMLFRVRNFLLAISLQGSEYYAGFLNVLTISSLSCWTAASSRPQLECLSLQVGLLDFGGQHSAGQPRITSFVYLEEASFSYC